MYTYWHWNLIIKNMFLFKFCPLHFKTPNCWSIISVFWQETRHIYLMANKYFLVRGLHKSSTHLWLVRRSFWNWRRPGCCRVANTSASTWWTSRHCAWRGCILWGTPPSSPCAWWAFAPTRPPCHCLARWHRDPRRGGTRAPSYPTRNTPAGQIDPSVQSRSLLAHFGAQRCFYASSVASCLPINKDANTQIPACGKNLSFLSRL